jgi:hypothetical protein
MMLYDLPPWQIEIEKLMCTADIRRLKTTPEKALYIFNLGRYSIAQIVKAGVCSKRQLQRAIIAGDSKRGIGIKGRPPNLSPSEQISLLEAAALAQLDGKAYTGKDLTTLLCFFLISFFFSS